MTDYAAVLEDAYSDYEWSITDNDPSSLVWHSKGKPPTQTELDALWPSVRDARAWAEVRHERDRMLAASDWTQAPDAPVDQQAWADYRQALRDIPQTFTDPDAVTWPEAP